MCARTAVEDVAQDVQLVDAQLVDDVADSHDEAPHLSRLDDGLHDALEVGLLVVVDGALVQQFLDDVCELRGQGFAHLAPRVFAADGLADLYELQQGAGIEVGEVLVGTFLYHLEALLGVVDEGAEVAHDVLGQRALEEVVHLALDIAAGVAQDVEESLVLAVDVGHEVLRAFRQVEDGLQVDDFGAGALAVGKGLREELQQSHVGIVVYGGIHGSNRVDWGFIGLVPAFGSGQ